jgi:hypothetical protein
MVLNQFGGQTHARESLTVLFQADYINPAKSDFGLIMKSINKEVESNFI